MQNITDIIKYVDQYFLKINKMICEKFNDSDCFMHIKIIEKTTKTLKNLKGIYFLEVDKTTNYVDFEKIGEQINNLLSSYKSINGNVYISSESKNIMTAYVLNGYLLTDWRFDIYKKPKNQKLNIMFQLNSNEQKQFKTICKISKSVILTRYLSLIPANVLNPETYTTFIQHICKKTNIKVEILDVKKLKKSNMNLVLAVGQGSQIPPRVIILKIGKNPQTALIGKGITYDTGGLSLKDSKNMETMFYDMTGSAVVLSTLLAIQDENVSIYGVLPLVENAIGSLAYKPGDIIISKLGKSVEIGNTDAEGRLILADSACFAAQDLKCKNIICIGTLTGAAKVALGTMAGALLSRENSLIKNLEKSWAETGELLHALPFGKEYEELGHSSRADISNVSGGEAGTIFGWLFIKMLCPENINYAGIDIAACLSRSFLSAKKPLCNATCVRSMITFVQSFCNK